MISIERLSVVGPFAGQPNSVVSALAAVATELNFRSDQTIFLTGDSPRGWYVLLDGCVRVVRSSSGRQHVIHTEMAGGTLGEVPLFAGGVHPATAIASEPTACLLFGRESLDNAIRAEPAVAFMLLEQLALRVRRLVERLNDRSARSVTARLAAYLLDRRKQTTTASISLGMTLPKLAEELGTVREVVSRELLGLRKATIIESQGGGRYVIADEPALRAVAALQM